MSRTTLIARKKNCAQAGQSPRERLLASQIKNEANAVKNTKPAWVGGRTKEWPIVNIDGHRVLKHKKMFQVLWSPTKFNRDKVKDTEIMNRHKSQILSRTYHQSNGKYVVEVQWKKSYVNEHDFTHDGIRLLNEYKHNHNIN